MGIFSSKEDPLADACCDVKLVIVASKNLEALLEKEFGATGRGLHEKISSAQGIDEQTKRRLRKIATIRNRLIHEVGFDQVPDKENFKKDFHAAVAALRELVAQRKTAQQPDCAIS